MGLFDDNSSVGKVTIKGHDLICPICGNDSFYQRTTQLNTAGMTFLGLDWANQNAFNYYCSECGYMFWFHPLD